MFGNKKELPDWARVENHAIRTITYGHVAVHDDGYCKANDYFAALDASATREYLFRPAAGLELHIDNLQIAASAAVLVDVFRGPIVTVNGTAILHHRLNGWSKKNLISVYHTPTLSDAGTLVERERINGSTTTNAAARVGGESSGGEEIIVPESQTLLIRFTGVVNATILSFKAGFYEVRNGATRP